MTDPIVELASMLDSGTASGTCAAAASVSEERRTRLTAPDNASGWAYPSLSPEVGSIAGPLSFRDPHAPLDWLAP